jgi:hypothetical protein
VSTMGRGEFPLASGGQVMPKAIPIARSSIVVLILLLSMSATLAQKRCGPNCPKALQDQEELERTIQRFMPIGTKCSRILDSSTCSFSTGANIAFSITGKVEPEPTIRVDVSFENVDAFENQRPYVASIYDFFVALDWSEKDLDSCMLTKSPEPGKAVTVRNSKQGTMLSCSFGKGSVSYLLHLQLEPDFTR